MKRWKKNLLVLALLSFAVIFANVTPKYHTVSAASKTTLNYKKKTGIICFGCGIYFESML